MRYVVTESQLKVLLREDRVTFLRTNNVITKDDLKKYKQAVFYKNISKACLKSDLVIIHTEWNEFKTINFKKIVKKNNIKIFDMRNVYSPAKMKKNNIKYFSIGR